MNLHNIVSISQRGLFTFLAAAVLLSANSVSAATRALEDISHSVLSGDRVEVRLKLTGEAPEPGSFTIDDPARIAIDLPDTGVALTDRFQELDAGPVRSVRVVEGNGRTRVVVALTRMVDYELDRQGDTVRLTLGGASAAASAAPRAAAGAVAPRSGTAREVSAIDFRRGPEGEGRVIVTLDPGTGIDMQERSGDIIVRFLNARLPERLERRLDVVDFATPVNTVDAYNTDGGVRLVIDAQDPSEHLAYQTDDTYTLEVKPVAPADDTPRAGAAGEYTGEPLSLNFQNIEVRAVLQLIADFTGLNIVASDTVSGQITLRLKNVPWDQALDIILKSKGLGMRQAGNVVLIAPNEELAAREKQELEAQQQMEELAPLRTRYFQINYAKAEDIAALLAKDGEGSILSPRGSISIDGRTNMLMVRETAEQLQSIGLLIEKLDIPIRQVLIESRIVIANDDFSRDLGVRFGYNSWNFDPDQSDFASGTVEGTSQMWDSFAENADGTFEVADPSQRLNVDLAAPGAAGQLAVAFITGDYLIDLELSALQTEGKGEVLSNPRVVTANQQEAVIKQGVEIPYQEASASGATSTSFKEAVLALSVTPQITPDDRVIMDLKVSKDSQGQSVNGIPTINTRAVETQVLVNNGDTVVLGGIYEQTRLDGVEKVPLLGDLPLLGHLFKRTTKEDSKAELLIFVTPKVLKEGLQTTRFER